MTVTKTRAALAALLLAAAPLAITAAQAQDRETSNSSGELSDRLRRNNTAKPATPQLALSSAVAKPLGTAQTAMIAKKWPDALTAAKEAEAAAKTDYEKMKVNQFLTTIYINSGNDAGADQAAEAAADTPPDQIGADDKLQVYYVGTALALNNKHYDKAATYAKQLIALNANEPRYQEVIAKALYAAGDAAAPAYFQKQVDTAVAAGKPPNRDVVTMLMNSQIKAKDEAGAEKTLEQSLLWFNDKNDWQQMIDVTMSTRGIRDIDAVMLGRLLFLCGATVSKEDADLVGQTTQKLALYGDAQQAVAHGATLTLDPARIAADKASMGQQIAAGASQNGQYNVKVGEAAYSYGMYAEAEAAAKAGLAKGGADASEAQMLIGVSQVAQGKYADAIASFGQVQGGSAATPRIARLWTVYAQLKQNPAGPSTAAK
jgi:hypothetical protein